jgi:hypoxanthine phosphoribosyltransferase
MTQKLKIKTLNDADLREAAIALNNLVFKDFLPEIIIGIKTGGYIVAELMAREAAHKPLLFAVSMQRESTKKKAKLKNIIRHFPYFITDSLRILEHKTLNGKPAEQGAPKTISLSEIEALRAALQGLKNAKILIVDDAVDSGRTLQAVFSAAREASDLSCEIRNAAITLTTDFSIINPDYLLYKNVLCRFPWSFDFRG